MCQQCLGVCPCLSCVAVWDDTCAMSIMTLERKTLYLKCWIDEQLLCAM